MSEREACITVTGLYNQADVLCIKTCPCLHAAVRRYKQMLVRCRGWTPDVRKGGTHHTGRAKQSTRRAEHKNLLMPARSGMPVQAKCWYAARDEPLMSKREARITLTGLNKQADVLCIKTFLCLHAAVRRYKLNVGLLPGRKP